MRNLKRALSLTLASVMLLGMMVVGTSAASYPDVTEEHNVEAIEVLQAVGVMSGSDSGNFNPDSQVSRIEMAVVMSNLLNLKVDYFENQCRFTDVPAWAGKYVAACEASGIVSGIGNNQFGVGNVTATQAALMMLKALGYFQYASDFAGGWEQETAKLTANLGLFKGLSNVYNTTELTRNQVAQLALNTLKTPVVVPDDNTLHITTTVGGADTTVTSGKVTYKVTASNDAYARAISPVEGSDQTTINGIQGWVVELGEQLYDGKLQLHENARVNDIGAVYDDFGRPARKWQYDGTTFGTYPKVEELRQEYTVKVTGKDLYDLLGSDIVNSIRNDGQWTLNVTIDGETTQSVLGDAFFSIKSILRTNTEKVGDTDKGTLTQVYVDSVNHEVNIAIINTYLAIAEQDYNERDNDVDLKVYRISDDTHKNQYVKSAKKDKLTEIITANGEDLNIVDVKEDDKFLVNVANGEIKVMAAPEIVSETTINSFKEGSWVKNDDATYDYASTAQYDDEVLDEYDAVNMKDVTYNVILDKYGYLVGLELNEAVNQYAFLTGIDLGESNLSVKNATANVILMDGTMQTVTVNVDKSEFAKFAVISNSTKDWTITGGGEDLNAILSHVPGDHMAIVNTWCTYTVDGNGVYTLKQVGSRSDARKDTVGPVRNAKKVAQSYIDVGQLAAPVIKDAGKYVINNKNTSILGSAYYKDVNTNNVLDTGDWSASGSTGVTGDFNYVYGNNETVFINAKVRAITVKGGSGNTAAAVEKIDSVTTGIANVDLTVKDLTDHEESSITGATYLPDHEIYTLYNDKGYAIAVVTLAAEDNGASSHFAYITGKVNEEDYIGDNNWKWYVDAIVDGKKVRLTEVDDGMDYLKNMVKDQWYSVTYDKDGNVNGLKAEGTNNGGKKNPLNFSSPTTDKFVTDVGDVRAATNGIANGSYTGTTTNDTVLLYRDFRCNAADDYTADGVHAGSGTKGYMKVEGDTLYTSTTDSEGIRISPNTKTVLILSKGHNTDTFDEITDGFEGAEGLDRALKILDTETVSKYTKFDGVLTAIFDRGVATVIILNDESGNGRDAIEESDKPMVVTVELTGTDGSHRTLTVRWNGKGSLDDLVKASMPAGWKLQGSVGSITYVPDGKATVTGSCAPERVNTYPAGETLTVVVSTSTNGSKAAPYTISAINHTGRAPSQSEVETGAISYAEDVLGLRFTGNSEGYSSAGNDNIDGVLYEFKDRNNVSRWIAVMDDAAENGPMSSQKVLSGTVSSDAAKTALKDHDEVILSNGANASVNAADLANGKTLTLNKGSEVTITGADVAGTIENSGTVNVESTGNITEAITGNGTVNVKAAANVTKIAGNATVNVTAGATIGEVSGAATVTLNSESVATVSKVSDAATVNVQKSAKVDNVVAAATINVSKEATVTLGGTSVLPTITGEGVVELDSDMSGTPGTSVDEYPGNLAKKLGLTTTTMRKGTEADGKTNFTADVAASPKFAPGANKIIEYSSVLTLNDIKDYAGGGAKYITFQEVRFNKADLIAAGCVIKSYYTKNGTDWTQFKSANGEGKAMFGSVNSGVATTGWDANTIGGLDSTIEVIMPVTNGVTGIKFVVEPLPVVNEG